MNLKYNIFSKGFFLRAIAILLLTVGVNLFFKTYSPEDSAFATIVFGSGLFLLLVFSPKHKFREGLRFISLIDWIAMIILASVMFIALRQVKVEIKTSVMMVLSLFTGLIGFKVFCGSITKKSKSR